MSRRVLVGVKRVIDYNVKIRAKPDKSGIVTEGVKMSMNPFDEIAVEEALKLKEKGFAKEVVALSVGSAKCEETLRTALAMGADRAILVVSEDPLEPFHVAKVFKSIVDAEKPDLVIVGKQAIDDDAAQVGPMIAGVMNWPQGICASKVEVSGDQSAVKVTREVDGGLETVDVKLPALLSADLRLNTPRYVTLPNILKAKQKPLVKKTLADVGVDPKPRTKTLEVVEPAVRQGGGKVADVDELISKLKAKGVL